MNPGAYIKDIRAYKGWLSRICRTLAEEEKSHSGGYPGNKKGCSYIASYSEDI